MARWALIEIVKMNDKITPVQLSAKELTMLINAINETREALEDWAFPARMGASPIELDELCYKLKSALQLLKVS